MGALRANYKIPPGLYCMGTPDETAPVLVSCNYKLSFDALRQELAGLDLWLLVIDTRGINVWCAAGKGTFSTDEISYQVKRCGLHEVVSHDRLILPQLCAPGVNGHGLKKVCGFRGVFGPIRAADLPSFLHDHKATESMRAVTFPLVERLKLVPVEICLFWKPFLLILTALFLLAAIAPGFSAAEIMQRFIFLTGCTLVGLLSGALLVPALLPWIPGKQFWVKGGITGLAGGLALLAIVPGTWNFYSLAALLWIVSLSSYLGMLFTGSTPYTSLTGVAKEMKRGLPFQMIVAVLALAFWLWAIFMTRIPV